MRYDEYDQRTTKRMNELRKEGKDIRRPVRKVSGASRQDLYDRAKFNYRKSSQVLKRKDPLQKNGNPTPAAMQFRRWAEITPKTYKQVKEIQGRAKRQLRRYG